MITSPAFDPNGTRTLELLAAAGRFNQWTYETIVPFLNGNVLEIGSGIANISAFAIQAGTTITLSDINPEYRETLSARFAGITNVKAITSIDLQHPDFYNEYRSLEQSFDSIFMLNVIEHLEDDAAAIRNCRFLLRPGGHLTMLAPSYQYLYSKLDRQLGHYRRYTVDSLAALAANEGLTILHKQYFNLAGIGGWFVFGKLLKRSALGGEMKLYNKLVPLFRVLDILFFHKAGLSCIVVAKFPE